MRIRSTKLGVGDVFVRGKYRIGAGNPGTLSSALVLRLPAGSEDDFQGTGAFELAPMLVASTAVVTRRPWPELQGFLNAGVDFNTADVDASEADLASARTRAFPGVSLAAAFLARHPFERIGSPGFLDVPRVRGGTAPLFGLRLERLDYYDLSVGGRVNLWRDTLIGFANAIVPLNDDGLRADVIPLVGIEATF